MVIWGAEAEEVEDLGLDRYSFKCQMTSKGKGLTGITFWFMRIDC